MASNKKLECTVHTKQKINLHCLKVLASTRVSNSNSSASVVSKGVIPWRIKQRSSFSLRHRFLVYTLRLLRASLLLAFLESSFLPFPRLRTPSGNTETKVFSSLIRFVLSEQADISTQASPIEFVPTSIDNIFLFISYIIRLAYRIFL